MHSSCAPCYTGAAAVTPCGRQETLQKKTQTTHLRALSDMSLTQLRKLVVTEIEAMLKHFALKILFKLNKHIEFVDNE